MISSTGPCCHSRWRSEEYTSELQSQSNLVCRLLLEKKKNNCERRQISYHGQILCCVDLPLDRDDHYQRPFARHCEYRLTQSVSLPYRALCVRSVTS